MRCLLTTLLVLTFASPAAAGGLQPFPGVDYANIKAFNFNAKQGRPECQMPLEKGGGLCSSVRGEGRLLSKKQATKLLETLNDPASYKRDFAKCFIPHHAFVLYDAKGKAVAQVSVCFMCERLAIEPSKPSSRSLSEKGQKRLQSLCQELALEACGQ